MRERYEGDTREIRGRYEGDAREIRGRCEGDTREMRGRCERDAKESRHLKGTIYFFRMTIYKHHTPLLTLPAQAYNFHRFVIHLEANFFGVLIDS